MEARLTHCGSSESWDEDCRAKTRQWHPHRNSAQVPSASHSQADCSRRGTSSGDSFHLRVTVSCLSSPSRFLKSPRASCSRSMFGCFRSLAKLSRAVPAPQGFQPRRYTWARGPSPRAARAKMFKGLSPPVSSPSKAPARLLGGLTSTTVRPEPSSTKPAFTNSARSASQPPSSCRRSLRA